MLGIGRLEPRVRPAIADQHRFAMRQRPAGDALANLKA